MNKTSAAGTTAASYIAWHYSGALASWTRIARDIAWFLAHYFSIRLLLRTLFAPWKRLDATEDKSFFAWLVTATLMRLVGVLVRIPVILFGSAVWLLWWILYVFVLVVWLLAPVIAVLLLVRAYKLLVG